MMEAEESVRRILILTFLVSILSACTNVSRFEKDSLVAYGQLLDASKEPLYYSISIELKNSSNSPIMRSQLKFSPDSPPIPIVDIRPEFVERYLQLFVPPPQWPEAWKLKAKEKQAYSGNGFYIEFKEGQTIFISICSHCAEGRKKPIVGTADGQHFYKLPLTERQVIEVFGHPDRIYKVNEVRY